MFPRSSTIVAIVVLIVPHLIHRFDIPLDIVTVPHRGNQLSDCHPFALHISVEAQLTTLPLIHRAIHPIQRLQDILTLSHTGSLIGQRVTLNGKQRIIVVFGKLHRLPRQAVMVDMAPPLRNHTRLLRATPHLQHSNHRVITGLAPATHVNDHKVFRPDSTLLNRILPHLQQTITALHQTDVTLRFFSLLAIALDVAPQYRVHGTALRQTVKMLRSKRIVPRHGKRFARIAGILGHHQLLHAVFAAFLVIPVNLFQRATVFPQTALIIVQLLPQRLGVINGMTVNTNLVPWHKHCLLVAAASLRTQPLGMKIVPYTIGSGLQHNYGLWLQNDTAAHTPHHIVRVMHHTRLPVGNLAQVCHRDVIAANSILAT